MSPKPAGSVRKPQPRRVEPGEVQLESQVAGLLERLIFLSDGIFAIAMTLLVVQLAVPTLGSGSSAELQLQLTALGPRYFSYAISFLVVASFWTSHQRIFRYILRADTTLVWLNILLLLCIAFQPFPTSVLGAYATPTSVAFYAGTMAVTGGFVLALWVYAARHRRLVSAQLDRRLIERHTWRAAIVPVVFLFSMAIAQVNPSAAEISWLALPLLVGALRWVYRDAS